MREKGALKLVLLANAGAQGYPKAEEGSYTPSVDVMTR